MHGPQFGVQFSPLELLHEPIADLQRPEEDP